MAKHRKLTATFKDGSQLTRTTSIPTLSHAWKAWGHTYWKDGSRHEFNGHGFASGYDKAHAALHREYPAKGKWGAYVIDGFEIVQCTEA